ncbi:hypothetical protein DL98DRAFT_537919 [Cadophora sp. DSE1049]|nr:hypothetical protein DL98DRAFT_537919 [Cadophora sp. DSE1049]
MPDIPGTPDYPSIDARKYVEAPAKDSKTVLNKVLFVNESATPRTGKKLGHRNDIRSHVRKQVITGRRKPVDERSSKGSHLDSRNGTGDRGVDARHESLAPGGGVRTWIEETFDVPQKDSPATSSRDALPQSQDPELESYDDLFGASTASLAAGRACTSHLVQLISTLDDVEGTYCLYCGAHRNAARPIRAQTNRQLTKRPPGLLSRKSTPMSWSTPSPLSILGAGRVDPFSLFVGAGSRVHELVDHSMKCVLPGMFAENEKTDNSISRTWYLGLGHPLLFHTLAFAGSIHLDFMRYEKIYPNSRVILSHKLTVIKILNGLLDDPKTAAVQDMALFAILMLASHDTMDMSRANNNPFDSPLKKTGWLNAYGTFVHMPEHLSAATELLSLRGGLEKLELRGLTQLFVGKPMSGSRPLFVGQLCSRDLQQVVQRLQTAIEWSRIESFGATFADLYLWILILGGIAALDEPERCWYVGQLLVFARRTGMRDWVAVEAMMGDFLWLKSACDSGGRKLWSEVLELGNVADILE